MLKIRSAKRHFLSLLPIVLSVQILLAPAYVYADDQPTPPPQSGSAAPAVTEIDQSYVFKSGNDQPETLNVSVAGIEVDSATSAKALAWYLEQIAEAKGPVEKVALLPTEFNASDAPLDLKDYQKIEIKKDGLAGLAADLQNARTDAGTPSRKSAASRLLGAVKGLFSNRYSLTVIRAGGVGMAAYTGFVFSKLPLTETLVAAATIGFISGAIQYNVKLYTDFLSQKGWFSRGAQALAGRIGQVFGLDYEKTKARLRDSIPFNFVFNQSLKGFLLQAAILAFVNFEFFALGSPLHPLYWPTVSSILVSSIFSQVGQGTLDSAISVHKDSSKGEISDACGARKDCILNRLEVTTAVKILAVALVANFATVLVAGDNSQTAYLGKQILTGVTIAGATYWSYLLSRYDILIRGKIVHACTPCAKFLSPAGVCN